MAQDNIYTQDLPGDFSFNSQVAEVFPDMINRSVPCYRAILDNLPIIARRYVKDHTNVYDLGCSLGAVTFAIRQGLNSKDELEQVNFIAVDNSQAMLERAELKLNAYVSKHPTTFVYGNLEDVEITNASMVVLNFVLQFLKPETRVDVLTQIYNGLNKGGVLILSEKFKNDDPFLEEEIYEMHHDFKRNNGYSDLEVQRKRNALENVMITDSMATHLARLEAIGFKTTVWQMGFNFCSFICYKV